MSTEPASVPTLPGMPPRFDISRSTNADPIVCAAAPGGQAWSVGDIVYNTAPATSAPIGWVCTVAGSPGTWKAFGTIS